jgi:hypothetical protein
MNGLIGMGILQWVETTTLTKTMTLTLDRRKAQMAKVHKKPSLIFPMGQVMRQFSQHQL